jgi:hypothetical protein
VGSLPPDALARNSISRFVKRFARRKHYTSGKAAQGAAQIGGKRGYSKEKLVECAGCGFVLADNKPEAE